MSAVKPPIDGDAAIDEDEAASGGALGGAGTMNRKPNPCGRGDVAIIVVLLVSPGAAGPPPAAPTQAWR